jgi:hypothetical protein
VEATGVLKITALPGKGRVLTLKFDGEIRESSVDIVRNAFAEQAFPSKRLRLNLIDVRYVDAVGIQLLRDLIRERAEISACSSFIAELLRSQQT